jgi:orotate phosphoribosyltransferase
VLRTTPLGAARCHIEKPGVPSPRPSRPPECQILHSGGRAQPRFSLLAIFCILYQAMTVLVTTGDTRVTEYPRAVATHINPELAKSCLRDIRALRTGHFVSPHETNGLGVHTTSFIDKTQVLMRAGMTGFLAKGMAFHLQKARPDTVLSLPTTAITVGHSIAECLPADFVFPEPDLNGTLCIMRDEFLGAIRGKRVAIVKAVINSGQSVRETIELVRTHGGRPVAVSALWNRGGATAESLGVGVLCPLVNEKLLSWSPEDCAVNGPCSGNMPINRRPGYGAELERLVQGARYRFV